MAGALSGGNNERIRSMRAILTIIGLVVVVIAIINFL